MGRADRSAPAPALVVTAAGAGNRLGELARAVPKTFLPVAPGADGWPESALARLVRQFRASGVARCWVAASEHPWFTGLPAGRGGPVVVPAAPRGEWYAVAEVLRAASLRGPVVIASGDNVFDDGDVTGFVTRARRGEHPCLVAAAHRGSTRRYTLIRTAGATVDGLVEKPLDGPPGLAKAGLYYLNTGALAQALTGGPRTDRFGEQSMTEVLLGLRSAGIGVGWHLLPGGFHDIGTPAGLAATVAGMAPRTRSAP